MTMNPNRGLVAGDLDLETGQHSQHDASHGTKFVRDITYKLIPFCGFSLVIFSVGAILVSTFAFDKPIPHQGTLVVSIILLSFFVVFCIGFAYLYIRKFRLRVKGHFDSTTASRQTSRSYHDEGFAKRFARTLKEYFFGQNVSPNDKTDHAGMQGANGGLFRSDTLLDPALSPNTYNRIEREQREAEEEEKMRRELEASANQHHHHPGQQQDHDISKCGGLRQGNVASTSRHHHAPLHHHTQNGRDDPTDRPPRGVGTQAPSMGDNAHFAVPLSHAKSFKLQWPIKNGPQDGYEQRNRSLKSGIAPVALAPALPIVPESATMSFPQAQSPVLGAQSGDAQMRLPKTRTRHGERPHYIPHEINGQRPCIHGVGPKKMNGHSDKTSAPPNAHVASRKPVAAPSSASIQNSGLNKKPPGFQPRPADYSSDYIKTVRQRNDHEDPRVEPRLSSTNAPATPTNINISTPSNTGSLTQHPGKTERQPQKRAYPLDTADSTDSIRPDTTKHRLIPAPAQSHDFVPRHPSAMPKPLRLVEKSAKRESPSRRVHGP